MAAILWFVLVQIASPFAIHAARVSGLPVVTAIVVPVVGVVAVAAAVVAVLVDCVWDEPPQPK